ncbi:MAG TPA: ABC-F family ATP-binding cassette domain-containing protein [Longimicrobiales bacterium]|nr:ABC-F family ATP-binding cassette domain-containing protein [Longimicrobiales bacterium]
MIAVSNLAMSYGDRTLFSGASFLLLPGERYGLVGANGSGKTTLLGILAGEIEPTEGTVAVPRGCRLGVLRQDHFLHERDSIMDVALMGNEELWRALSEKEALLARGEEHFDVERFAALEEVVQRHDGYGAEARAAMVLEGLGIPAEVHREPMSTLSGGFKLRVLLAQVLASAPDALLLDEPTNHLDVLSIRWLEKFLQSFPGPAVVISHDHRFLDNVATRILDVDYGTVTAYQGDYTAFLEQKAAERERREREIELRRREIQHHQEFVDRFRAKASKARQAQSKLRLIEKKASELVALPGSSRRYPTFRFEQRRPSGRDVLRAEGIAKRYGDKTVLDGVDLSVQRGDRVAIMGPNGIGKSTLLEILVGRLQPDAGSVTWGYEAHPGYFAQNVGRELEGVDRTLEDWLWSYCPGKDRGFVRGQLGLVLFSGDDGNKKLSALSGGEAARLTFARLALEQPNVLVLDEPTNHLDLESIEALVEGLRAFEGTLILVSHDRWFVSRLADRIVEIRPEGIIDYRGTYEEYVHLSGDDHLDVDRVVLAAAREKRKEKASRKGARPRGGGSEARGPSRAADMRSRRELELRRDELMARLDAAERRVGEIDARFCEPGYFERTPPEEVSALDGERARLLEEIERATAEWDEVERALEELAS